MRHVLIVLALLSIMSAAQAEWVLYNTETGVELSSQSNVTVIVAVDAPVGIPSDPDHLTRGKDEDGNCIGIPYNTQSLAEVGYIEHVQEDGTVVLTVNDTNPCTIVNGVPNPAASQPPVETRNQRFLRIFSQIIPVETGE